RLRFQCSPYHTNSALHPFIAPLERAAGFKADDTSEQRLDKLEAVLAVQGSRIEAVAPLFAALLSIPFGGRYPPLAPSPPRPRRDCSINRRVSPAGNRSCSRSRMRTGRMPPPSSYSI